MANTRAVSISGDRQFAFPPEMLATLNSGDEYLVWQTNDTIVLKKVAQPLSLDTLLQRIEDLGPDLDQPSAAEICQIVKEIRHERAKL